jgi:multidrug efflux pump subunit AcrA (membrane-fusion protein)
MDHLQEQLADCTITAPADGMVVYASSGDRWAQTQIQEGAQVRERQTIMRLPDTTSMKAIARIGETQVGRLSNGMRAKVRIAGIPNPIGATVTKISVLADSSQRFFNPDLKEYPVDLVLDDTPKSLKPGMGANVEILVNHFDNVLGVPLAAIYSAGPDTYVFVRDDQKVRPVKVKIGQSNDTHGVIKEGLEAGAEVLLLQAGQGRDLLEQNGIKVQDQNSGGDQGFGRRPHGQRGNGNGQGAPGAAVPDANGRGDRHNNDAPTTAPSRQ